MRARRRACVGLLVVVAALSACTGSGQDKRHSGPWRELDLPAEGARIVVLAPTATGLIAFGSLPGPGGRAPAAWTTGDAEHWHRLATAPVTGYGQVAEFIMGTVAGTQVTAFGQAYGGAHSNPRPTLWNGTPARLAEHEQVFTMFGGEDVISQNAEAARRGLVVLVGGWDQAGGGYGAASWTSPDGATWTRHVGAPGLASGRGEQTSAVGITTAGGEFVAAGNTLRDDGSTHPLAWTSDDGATWQRLPLPTTGGSAAAWQPTCAGTHCALIGTTIAARARLLCWSYGVGRAPALGASGASGGLIQPLQAGPDGKRILVVAAIDSVARLFRIDADCSSWHEIAMPVRAAKSATAVLHGEVVLATTADSTSPSRLWAAHPAG